MGGDHLTDGREGWEERERNEREIELHAQIQKVLSERVGHRRFFVVDF